MTSILLFIYVLDAFVPLWRNPDRELRRRAIVVGYALSGLVRAMFTVTLVTTVALAAGMRVGGDGLNLLTLYLLALTVNQAAYPMITRRGPEGTPPPGE